MSRASRVSILLLMVLSLGCASSAPENSTPPPAAEKKRELTNGEKHRLYQAAAIVENDEQISRMLHFIGLADAEGVPNSLFDQFTADHAKWADSDTQFVLDHSDKAKAQAYVDEHMPN